MTLAEQRLKELDNLSLTGEERALLRCRLATEFIRAGQYEIACQALGEFWRGVGEGPDLEGLAEKTRAEVLLHVGVLSGWIGACRQIQGAQESAKNLISQSAALFESLGLSERAAAARCKLALCYWREGAYDEARVLLMQIMAEKGLVRRDESERAHRYEPAAREEETQRQLVGDLLRRAFDGSAKRLVMQALSTERAGAEELEEIRRLLDRLERGEE